MKILTFIEQRDGKIKSSALEAITIARKLAGSAADVAAVVVGNNVQIGDPDLKGYGVDKIFAVNNANLDLYNVLTYSQAVGAAIETFKPQVVLGIASPMGRDLLPRLAARYNGGILTDLISVQVENGFIAGTKPMYAGKCLADVAIQNSEIQFVSIRPNVVAAAKSNDGAAAVENLNANISVTNQLKTKEIRAGKSKKADLTEASVIISGGRALGSAENFKVLEECAEVIGATVGASRAAVDSGYAPHDMQVGQTGKTVNPNLYIACGISGSIQHMAGMRTSKTIVAVNTDAEAPIFTIADYGIVGDLFQVVPLLTKKFKELLK
ncbi:MAG: electron transfer flavoprotein subunit alpha/FixB family protein [Oligoflexales bacterium]